MYSASVATVRRILQAADDPRVVRRINGLMTLFWLAMILVAIVTGWISSVTYVAALTLWTLVHGSYAAWQASRLEVRLADEAAEREEHPPEQALVQAIIDDPRIPTRN